MYYETYRYLEHWVLEGEWWLPPDICNSGVRVHHDQMSVQFSSPVALASCSTFTLVDGVFSVNGRSNGGVTFGQSRMAMWKVSSLPWATTMRPLFPATIAPAAKRVQLPFFSRAQFQVSSVKKEEVARILPDYKPLNIPATFPWEGSESRRSLLLLDGNAILYRAYFKIMAKVQYGSLKDMGSEADWVLTVFAALSTVFRLLEIQPSHIAAAFDYKGLTFRHELYKPYKSGRPPTPDTVCQAISCLKPALLSLGVSVVEVAGVEADDVIATFGLRAVEAGMNVSIASPDKDFFQIISPQLRLLRFMPRGSDIVQFGVKEFQERFGDIQPRQHLEVLALMGDKVDNIPGLDGVGEITALKLVKEFGTVENLLANRDKVKFKRPRISLMADDGGVLLSKKLLSLKVDMPNHMLPYSLDDFVCQSPEDNGEQFTKLLNAMSAYVDPSISEEILDRATQLWKRWDSVET